MTELRQGRVPICRHDNVLVIRFLMQGTENITGDLLDKCLDPPRRIRRLKIADCYMGSILFAIVVVGNKPGVRGTDDVHVLIHCDCKELNKPCRWYRVAQLYPHFRSPSIHESNHSFWPRMISLMPHHLCALESSSWFAVTVPAIWKPSSLIALSKARA